MRPQKLIDGHVHLLPKQLMRAIFNWFRRNRGWEMPYKMDTQEYITFLTEKLGAQEFMALAYVHKIGISQEINNWLADLADRNPGLKPFASVYQDDLDKELMLKELLDQRGFYGVKIHCAVQRISAGDERFKPVYKLLAERNKGLVLHASSMNSTSVQVTTPEEVAYLLDSFPGMKIMVAHLGVPEFLDSYVKLLERYQGLYFDTAILFGNPLLKSGHLESVLKAYPDKIIYGSDFPLVHNSPEQAIEELLAFNLGSVNEEKIFYSNAKRFLGEKV